MHARALDAHQDLLSIWRDGGDDFVRACVSYLEWVGEVPDEALLRTARIEVSKLASARTFCVTDSMCVLAEHVASKMEPETLEPFELPAPAGFVLLEAPVRFAELDPDEPIPEEHAIRREGWLEMTAVSWGPMPADAGDELALHVAIYGPRRSGFPTSAVSLYNQHQWTFGVTEVEAAGVVIGEGDEVRYEYTACHEFLKALWMLLDQQIAVSEGAGVDRHARRRAVRQGLEPTVRVIDLRRRVPQPAMQRGEGRDWSSRWLVDGHLRSQWYPSLGVHRQIWIEAYEKGPLDKPLKLKDKVYRLKR